MEPTVQKKEAFEEGLDDQRPQDASMDLDHEVSQ